MNDAERRVTFSDVLDEHPHGTFVENVLETRSFTLHLSPYAVNMLGPAADVCVESCLRELAQQL